jgi:hypothetical protein
LKREWRSRISLTLIRATALNVARIRASVVSRRYASTTAAPSCSTITPARIQVNETQRSVGTVGCPLLAVTKGRCFCGNLIASVKPPRGRRRTRGPQKANACHVCDLLPLVRDSQLRICVRHGSRPIVPTQTITQASRLVAHRQNRLGVRENQNSSVLRTKVAPQQTEPGAAAFAGAANRDKLPIHRKAPPPR